MARLRLLEIFHTLTLFRMISEPYAPYATNRGFDDVLHVCVINYGNLLVVKG